VIVGRALFDLDSGDPLRMARARSVLVAFTGPQAAEALRRRVEEAPEGSAERLQALALLAERGDSLEGLASGEIVAMNLGEIAADDGRARSSMLALSRLRGMGEEARTPLREAARDPGPRGDLAARVLRLLFGEEADRTLHRPRP
jgi:hypothetical protein